MKMIWISLFVLLGIKCSQPSGATFSPNLTEKINGVSFVASGDGIDHHHISPVINVHANYASVMPFGFIKELESPEVIFNADGQWYGETLEGSTQYISELQSHGIKVMLKPQLWVGHGLFTGDISMKSEDEWQILERTYGDFILSFAQVSQDRNISIYCIGTELRKFIEARPDYWNKLIQEVKAIYKGNITYAANWDEYKDVPFLAQLDYIGVDAYFPLTDDKDVEKKKIAKGWEKWISELEETAVSFQKPILFTEYGYRSCDYAGKEPWNSDHHDAVVNLDNQVKLLESLYDQVWDKEWMAGGFVWKWFIDYDHVGGLKNNRFTPQNKPAEITIKNHNIKYQ